jgi:hypothetical protein
MSALIMICFQNLKNAVFSKNAPLSVIPVKTGIQCIRAVLDTRLRGYDKLSSSKSILR